MFRTARMLLLLVPVVSLSACNPDSGSPKNTHLMILIRPTIVDVAPADPDESGERVFTLVRPGVLEPGVVGKATRRVRMDFRLPEAPTGARLEGAHLLLGGLKDPTTVLDVGTWIAADMAAGRRDSGFNIRVGSHFQLGGSEPHDNADFDRDGPVDGFDLEVWQRDSDFIIHMLQPSADAGDSTSSGTYIRLQWQLAY